MTTASKPAAPSWRPAHVVGERRSHRRWVPLVAGVFTFLLGVRDIAMVVRPHLWERVKVINHVLPGKIDPAVVHGAVGAALVVAGALLILLSHALRRRKRRAWRAVVAILVVTATLHLLHGPFTWRETVDWLPLDAVFVVALVLYRKEFFAVGDPRTRWLAVWAFLGLTAGSFVLGALLIEVRPDEVVGSAGFFTVAQHVLYGLVGVSGPIHFHSDRSTDLITWTLATMGAFTALTTVYLLFRPAEPRPSLGVDDEAQMRDLLAKNGELDSLGYFALRRDKSVIWSATRKSCIAYRVLSGVMLATGDPLGDPEAWPGAIKEFMIEAERHAWVPAVLACSELGGDVWTRETEMSALELGDEAIVDVGEFSLDGRTMRNVRQMVNRVERAGYTAEIYRVRDLPPEMSTMFRREAESWRGAETERGYSMALGRLGDPADGDCVAVAAMKDGMLRAFLYFVPWGSDGLSLDLMRRDRAADPGLNEYLITAALRVCPRLGVTRMSLNFAVFRSALERGGRLGAGPVIRAWRGILVFASRWFQIESLYRFNAKFQPEWQPRYIVFPGASDLPRIAIAALEAEAFIVWPHPRIRQLRKLMRLGPAA
ncbi:MAG TPA: phosphatidylglycerol lysyltransferase domain-containing protein [Acidothermaceae bacterium]|nr:phosphatidylglycerol lysyltransferase domain-containing protein [Acidothermaceae bacterium]